MTPIDDELRSMFQSRTDVLSPSPDPLAGIERRARRIRRNRVAASVAGTALAVAAVAVVVPAVMPERSSSTPGIQYATQPPSPQASASPSPAQPSSAALDPQHPWAYRGDAAVLGNGNLETVKREWALRHPGTTLTPLFGQVYEPSGQAEIVFVSTAQGSDRWGVAVASEGGPEFPVDQALAYGATALLAALPGDDAPRLVVLAAPGTGDIAYAADGTSFTSVPMAYDGIAFRALEGDTSRDAVRVLDGDGDEDHPVFVGPAPDAGSADGAGAPRATTPDNLVTWPSRGETPDRAFWSEALAAFATGLGAKPADVEGKVLYAGGDEAGNRFVFGQAWISGNDAHTFGYSKNSRNEATPFLGPVTDKGPGVLAFLVPAGPGQRTETLVVVPEPAVAQAYYGEAQSEYDSVPMTDGVAIVNRRPGVQGDMLRLLGANGQKLFEGQVEALLCGVKECG